MDSSGLARLIVNFHKGGVQFCVLRSRVEFTGYRCEKTADRILLDDTDHGIEWTRHADVCLECRTSWQNGLICSWDVRVCSDHRRNAAIQIPTHSDLL